MGNKARAVAALGTALGVAAFAAAAIAGPEGAEAPSRWGPRATPERQIESHEDGETLVLLFRDRQENQVDVDGPGTTPGDYFAFAERLESKAGADLGDLYGRCMFHFGALQCEGVFKLDGVGDITVQGAFRFSDPAITLAVTGGTDHYQDVRGEGHFTSFGRGVTGIIFHLTD